MKTFKEWPAWLALVAALVWHQGGGPLVQAADSALPARPVRLAVLESSRGSNGGPDPHTRGVVLDLLTSRLSTAAGFELVERASLETVLRELSLSAASLATPGGAVQVGRMVKADWFLLLSFPAEITNAVVGKILDASTGVIRDLQIVPLKQGDPSGAAEALAVFVEASRRQREGLGRRLWIGFGGFEDLGLYRRYRDFGDWLRLAMTLKYASARVSVVERSQMAPLVEEMRLSLDGFTEVSTNGMSAQPAFVLVDGLYQAFRDEQTKINLVLRMEWVGGRRSVVAIKELPGTPLEAKVFEAIDRFLAMSAAVTMTNSPSRQAEAKVQRARGRELARIGSGYIIPVDGVSMWNIFPPDRAPRVREAISAFESASFLEPENLETQFALAACLADPLIDQLDRARDIWREIAATSTSAKAIYATRSALAFSYIERDDIQAYELIGALLNTTTNAEQQASLDNRLSRLRSDLGGQGRLAPQDILQFATDEWRTECHRAEQRLASIGSLDVYRTFTLPMDRYYHAFKGTNSTQGRREHIGMVVSNLVKEFPRFEPYLVADYARGGEVSPFWKAWHERTLAACEEHPERITAPTNYYCDCLKSDLQSFIARREYELADRVARMFEKKGRDYLTIQQSKDDLDFLIGHVRFKLGRFEEAITAFERIGSRQVWTAGVDEVWGKVRFISGIRAAEICRGKANLAGKPTDSPQRQLLKPVQILPGAEIWFAVDGGEIWLADRIGFYRYQIQSGELKPVQARIHPRVRRVLVYRNKVWFATAEGLYAFDPESGTVLTNNVDNGLLMPSVTALAADGDRMWLGFGENQAGSSKGGLGYLKLSENHFVGLMPELMAAPTRVRPVTQSEGAPRRYVTGLAKPSDGPLWIIASSQLLRYDGQGADAWKTAIPYFSGAVPAGVVASSEHVVVPCYEPNGWSSTHTNFGGVFVYDIQKMTHRRLTSTDGLPNNKLYAAVLDGKKAWLGGEGFLALLDLSSMRVEKTLPLQSALSVRSMALAGNELWFSCGPGLYRLPRNGDVESRRPDGDPPASPATLPEITDVQSARELLKKRDELYRTYGTRETAEYQEMTARYHAFVRRSAKDFPLLESPSRKGTNHFLERIMNKEGRSYDGFRFKCTMTEPADFGWIFAYEWPTSFQRWFILPVENAPMTGFTDSNTPKIAYTNAPWTGLNAQFGVQVQFLHDGQLMPGKEYIIWLDFQDERPARFFMAFDLFPASARHRSRTVLKELLDGGNSHSRPVLIG